MRSNLPESSVRSEINVTPLVDVCLVLLIIFMVVTPLIGNGGKVALPETQKPVAIAEGRDQVTLTVDAAGLIFINEKWVDAGQLKAALTELHTNSPQKQIRLRADRYLNYGAVRNVMRSVSEAGFTRADIVTLQKT
jgi:biopolymer transport protein TolR